MRYVRGMIAALLVLVPVELGLRDADRATMFLRLRAPCLVAARVAEDTPGVDDERLTVNVEVGVPAACSSSTSASASASRPASSSGNWNSTVVQTDGWSGVASRTA